MKKNVILKDENGNEININGYAKGFGKDDIFVFPAIDPIGTVNNDKVIVGIGYFPTGRDVTSASLNVDSADIRITGATGTVYQPKTNIPITLSRDAWGYLRLILTPTWQITPPQGTIVVMATWTSLRITLT